MTGFWLASYLTLWLFVLLQALLLLALIRHIGNLRLWLRQAGVIRDMGVAEEGVSVGTTVENLTDLVQSKSNLSLHEDHRAKMLLFVPAGFFGCDELLPSLKEFEEQYGDILQLIIVSFEPAVEDQFEVVKRMGIRAPIITEHGWKIAQVCQVVSAPYAMIVDWQNVVRSKLPVGDAQGLEELVQVYYRGVNSFNPAGGE
ncbi:MAG: hypothetical protein AB1345_01905 [Chloroflexota bacterium]